MFRLVSILNVSLGLVALGLILSVIIIKSTIANEAQQTRSLTARLDTAYARRDALEAEWARLQNRSNILALGQALFDGGVEEIAEEIAASDLPMRDTIVDGRAAALSLFTLSLDETAAEVVLELEMSPSDHIGQLISEDLEG